MVFEEDYSEGLNAFLKGEVDKKDLKEISNSIFYHLAYLGPGVGLYREFKKPRNERSIGETIAFGLYTVPLVIKLALLPAYVGKGVATGNWNPFNFDKKYKTEQIEDLSKKENKSEKLNYLERELDSQDLLNE